MLECLLIQRFVRICIHKTYSNLYLRKELDKAEQKDKGLITTIVYGTYKTIAYVAINGKIWYRNYQKQKQQSYWI